MREHVKASNRDGEEDRDYLMDCAHYPQELRQKVFDMLCDLASSETPYWERDSRGENLYIGSLPHHEDECDYTQSLFCMIKQDNNGSTFMVSPFELPHLGTCYLPKPQSIDFFKKVMIDIDNIMTALDERIKND